MKRVFLALGLLVCAAPLPLMAQTTSRVIPPDTQALTSVSITCASTSTPFTNASNQYLTIQVPPNATQTVWFAWGGTTTSPPTATTAPPSQGYGAGTNIAWGGGMGSCIVVSGTQVISVGTK